MLKFYFLCKINICLNIYYPDFLKTLFARLISDLLLPRFPSKYVKRKQKSFITSLVQFLYYNYNNYYYFDGAFKLVGRGAYAHTFLHKIFMHKSQHNKLIHNKCFLYIVHPQICIIILIINVDSGKPTKQEQYTIEIIWILGNSVCWLISIRVRALYMLRDEK